MANGNHERELREEWDRLEAETADPNMDAETLTEKLRRKSEILEQMERLGIGIVPDPGAIIVNDPR